VERKTCRGASRESYSERKIEETGAIPKEGWGRKIRAIYKRGGRSRLEKESCTPRNEKGHFQRRKWDNIRKGRKAAPAELFVTKRG